MTVRMDDYDEYESVFKGQGWISMNSWVGDTGECRNGVFCHPRGLIQIYQRKNRYGESTMILTASEGLGHRRMWRKAWSSKTLVRLCRLFIKDIAERYDG